jgi:hypothetical protein
MMSAIPTMLMAAIVSGLKMAALQAVLVAMEEKTTVLLRSVMVDVKAVWAGVGDRAAGMATRQTVEYCREERGEGYNLRHYFVADLLRTTT